MGVGYWKTGGPLMLVLPNLTALLLLAGTFLMLNWPPVSIRTTAIRLNKGNFQSERLEKSRNCSRLCFDGAKAKECHFKFILEPSVTGSRSCSKCLESERECKTRNCIPADGAERTMLTVNRQFPGTAIQVCEGDVVVVDVENHMPGLETSLHWHGQLQHGSPYMDGVPMITQCPIQSDTRFRYKFRASSPGTHFYHSHYVSHHADGIFGPFIVRQPHSRDPNSKLYDYDVDEHVMIISPWSHSILAYNLDFQDNMKISSILINGKGSNGDISVRSRNRVARTTFTVRSQKKYRFRIINAASLDCPVHLQVDKHSLTIIASDGSPVKATIVPHLVLYPGERYDVVITADQSVSSYWIQVRGHHKCEQIQQESLLIYDGASVSDGINEATQDSLNALSAAMLEICPDLSYTTCRRGMKNLRSSHREIQPELLTSKAEMKLYMPYDVYSYDNFDDKDVNFNFTLDEPPYYPSYLYNRKRPLQLPQLNRLSFSYPPSPILSQPENVPQQMLCDEKCQQYDKFCECLHIVRVPVNISLDIILVDEGQGSNHTNTFHLHGYNFLVLSSKSMGHPVTVSEVKAMDSLGKLKKNLVDPPRKDTVTVPNKGYTVIRLFSNNPGYWLFEGRSSSPVIGGGMQFILQVGDQSHLPPVPSNFPRCGILKGPNFIF